MSNTKQIKRHYFISDDLDELDSLEQELEHEGIADCQTKVLSLDHAAVEHRDHLHNVQSLMQTDVVRAGLRGFMLGLVGAVLVLLATWLFGWYETRAWWWPFIFLAVVVFGFFTWEGGLFGVQTLNANFQRFRKELENGRHVFFVDLLPEQEPVLLRVCSRHPNLQAAGTGEPAPRWVWGARRRLRHMAEHS